MPHFLRLRILELTRPLLVFQFTPSCLLSLVFLSPISLPLQKTPADPSRPRPTRFLLEAIPQVLYVLLYHSCTASSLVLGLALPLTGTFSLSPGSLKERKLGMWSVPFRDTECELADICSSVLCPKGQLDLGQAPSRLAFLPVGHGIYGKAVAFY